MEIYTTTEAGQLLDLRPTTIQKYIREGKLNAIKKGKTWLILSNDLEKLTKSEWYQIERTMKVGRPRKVQN